MPVKAPVRHARKLRWPAQILNLNRTQSSSGASVPGTPTVFAKVYADIVTEPGSAIGVTRQESGEPFLSGRLGSQLYHLVTIRYTAGVIPSMRFQATYGPFAGRAMDILTVNVVEGRMRWMELSCLERRTAGTP